MFGPIFEAILKGEMQNHLGYEKNGHTGESTNTRNGYSKKTLKTSLGEVPISVPRDRQGQFEPQIVKKYQRNVSSIEGKVLAMYARGMSQRDIAATIEDMYGFQLSHEQISNITDCVMEEVDRWRTRPLKPFYPLSFVDCIYVSMRTERGVHQVAVYVMLAYDTNGYKDVLGLWINETESKHIWCCKCGRSTTCVRKVEKRLAGISWCHRCLGKQLSTRRTALYVWQCSTKGNVHDQRH